ncbi:MAG: 50S ribosomal protein L4 [bacterium]
MATAKVYNHEGAVIGTKELPKSIFSVQASPALLRRAVEAQQRNSRPIVAHTKTRSEVRGGGRKPWRQKGTGRARHGSIRSPIWVGGGVTFGPRNTKNYTIRINRKERRKALLMGLSEKAQSEKVVLLDALKLSSPKTKQFALLLNKLPVRGRSTLVIQPAREEQLIRAARNIPNVTTIAANSLNIVDVLRHEYLLLPSDGLAMIEKLYQMTKRP